MEFRAWMAVIIVLVAALAAGCGGDSSTTDTGGGGDTAVPADTGGQTQDTGTPDTGTPDTGAADGGADGATGTGIEALPVDEEKPAAGLTAPVNIIRDTWGIPHIYAQNEHDLFFATGFMHAKDRYFQMELFRRAPSGTLALLFGARALAADEPIRIHHMRQTAQAAYDALVAGSDIKTAIDAYAEGVNFFVTSSSGMDLGIELQQMGITKDKIEPWTGVDSLAFARYQTYDLSFDGFLNKLDYYDAVSKLDAAFPTGDPREGIVADLHTLEPPRKARIIDTWPDGTTPAAVQPDRAARLGAYRANRPQLNLPPGLAHAARERLRVPATIPGLPSHLVCSDRHDCGSNNWIIGPTLTASGGTMVSNDTHLGLSNPSIWYEIHMDLARSGVADYTALGFSFPGGPGVILGTNGQLAWGATVSALDVTDYFVEEVDPAGGGTWGTVTHYPDGTAAGGAQQVPITARHEEFKYPPDAGSTCEGSVPQSVKDRHPEWTAAVDGALCVLSIDYPEVAHHGPVLSFSADKKTAISLHWTGYDPSNEVEAFYRATKAKSTDEFEKAFDAFRVGGQNFVMASRDGHIFWTESLRVPVRRTIDRKNPVYLPVPGTGDYDWTGEVDDTLLPHAKDPAKGYLVTANNDPLGIGFDGDPLKRVLDEGHPYLGFFWDPGWRAGRIDDRISNATGERPAGQKLTPDDMMAIQADHYSNTAKDFLAVLEAAVTEAKAADAGSLSADPALAGMLTAKMTEAWDSYLATWDYDTASGLRNETSAAEVQSSIAAAIYNAWLTTFVPYAVGDELAKAGTSMGDDAVIRGLHKIITQEDALVMAKGRDGHSIIFDDVSTPTVVETRAIIALKALKDGLTHLAATPPPAGFGTDDFAQWQWGKLHTLTLEHASGNAIFNVPPPTDKDWPHGFPRHGENWVVDAANYGIDSNTPNYDFTYSGGPAIRFVCELTQAGMKAWNAIPGGEIAQLGDKHYDDEIRNLWSVNKNHELWYLEPDVVANAEYRIVLKPH